MHLLRVLSADAATGRLRAGQLIAHATTSLLGIAADPLNAGAIARLNHLKARAAGRGYVHVVDQPSRAAGWVDDDAWRTWLPMRLPAPVTWILPAGPNAPARVVAADGSLAIRLDAHPCVAALCCGLARPIVSTSLNAAGAPPIADIAELPADLASALAGVFVLPPAPLGLPSTVVRVTPAGWHIVRHGALSEDALRAALRTTP